jgi:hypothetical protein
LVVTSLIKERGIILKRSLVLSSFSVSKKRGARIEG